VTALLAATGPEFERYAWRDSLLLNLVLQAEYALTVTTCRYVRHVRCAKVSCSSSGLGLCSDAAKLHVPAEATVTIHSQTQSIA
jgi:hypothetical protein